jgi:hypothetical protein
MIIIGILSSVSQRCCAVTFSKIENDLLILVAVHGNP